MPKATQPTGKLMPMSGFYVEIPIDTTQTVKIDIDNLPDISDSKTATYSSEGIIGRSSPLSTYSNSEPRSISLKLHLYVLEKADIKKNIRKIRAIQSATYPREGSGGAPFLPPPICQIKCGSLLSDDPLCVILNQYSVSYATDAVWDPETGLPYKVDIDTTWQVAYSSKDLPINYRIYSTGR